MAAAGLRAEDFQRPEPVQLWPENEQPINLFGRIATQWRTGPGGPIGLDYTVVYREIDRLKLGAEAEEEMMAAIRVIEIAALRAMRDQA